MLVKIPLLTMYVFSLLFPLCLWNNVKTPVPSPYHKYHLRITNIISGIAVVCLMFLDIAFSTKMVILFWKANLLGISRFYWKKPYPRMAVMSLPALFGTVGLFLLYREWGLDAGLGLIAGLLSGLLLCYSVYTMYLGHWYLNVPGLPILHLKTAVKTFAIVIVVRLIYLVLSLCISSVWVRGEPVSATSFLMTLDGFLLFVPVFFGVLLPLVSLYFVWGTLEVKSTQSATGILYVILIAVLLGQVGFQYYQIRYALNL